MYHRQRRQCTLNSYVRAIRHQIEVHILIKLSFVNAVLPSKWNSTVMLSW